MQGIKIYLKTFRECSKYTNYRTNRSSDPCCDWFLLGSEKCIGMENYHIFAEKKAIRRESEVRKQRKIERKIKSTEAKKNFELG